MRYALPILAITAILVACQQPGSPSAPPAKGPEPAPSAAAPPVDLVPVTDVAEGEPRWMLSEDGENHFLAFAVPETDDVRLSFECGPGERFVRLWRETSEDDFHDFRLTSGASSFTFPAEYEPEGMAPQLRGVAPGRAQVFLNFRETGQLSLTTRDATHDLSASAMARPLIESFFSYCTSTVPAS